jgi:catechol 2,3-dioxygenase-like lactoylglutathione lyase family enzyme
MARGIDHVVHVVRDLDAAAAFYQALGFQVGARNRHPPSWGTQNHIVQLPGCFVELLTVAEPAHIAPHGPRFFSFGAFNRDALARGEGLSMLVLESRDARADAQAFRESGICDFEVFEFEREARQPDGSPIKVAFALAFAHDPDARQIGFFTCQHRFPENFWNPAFQMHPNTANGIAGVAIVAANPSDHRRFLSVFTQSEASTSNDSLAVTTPRGDIQVMTPSAFERQFGEAPPDTAASARLAALRFAVRDLDAVARTLQTSGTKVRKYRGRLIVGAQSAMGATLVFEPLRGN